MRRIHLEFSIPETNEENVVGTLFTEYVRYQHQGNSFSISEHKLTMDVVFDDVPEEIISAIANLPYSNIISMEVTEEGVQKQEESEEDSEATQVEEYGIGEKDFSVEEGEKATGESNEQEDEVAFEGETLNGESSEEPKKKSVSRKSRNSEKKRTYEVDGVACKAIREIADKADSFEEFIELVGDFINIGQYRKFFNALIMSTSNTENQTTEMIFNNMEKYGEAFSNNRRIIVSQKVKNAFDKIGSESRLMAVVKEVAKYKDFQFKKGSGLFILGKEIIDVINKEKEQYGSIQFAFKVGIVLDMIRSDNHVEEYNEMRDGLIMFVTKTIGDVSYGIDLNVAFEKNLQSVFGEKSYKAKALLLQSIKEYCEKRGIDSDARNNQFFQDMLFLM